MSLPTVPCKGVGCSAQIAWIKTARGKMAPVDPEPVEAHILPARSGVGRRISLTTEEGETFTGERSEVEILGRTVFVRGYVSHFGTCPAHVSFRRAVHRRPEPAV